ncbi:MAG: hypothetical protein KDD44_14265, partial [Bdellovibrionales bacterium]|nr:hypothetical protein [Bdellovibrionales bacterium]
MLVAFYLGTYFEVMRHYATRVFGAAGPLANQELNMTDGIFPSLISAATDPQQVLLIFHAGLLLSVLLFFGIARQIVAFVLWVVWASLYNSNNYVADPSTPIVGWLLLFITLVPEGEKFSFFTFSHRKTASNVQLEND